MRVLPFSYLCVLGKARKARLRENRRKVRYSRSQRGWYFNAFLVAAGLGGVLDVGWSVLPRYVAQHPYFTLQEIAIDSDGPFSAEEVRTWSGVQLGVSLWDIDPARIEARLRAHSWVQTAQVRREFPQRVHATVKMRRPMAIVLHEPLTYLDDTGAHFVDDVGDGEIDLPYVSGLAGMALDTPTAQTVLAEVLHLLSLSRLWQEPLSEIHWDPRRGYTLFLADRQITICLGWEMGPENFAQLGAVLETWPVDGPAVLLDARFANQVVTRPYTDDRGQKQIQDSTRRSL